MQLPHEFALLIKLMVFFAQYLTLFDERELSALSRDFAAAATAFASTHLMEMRELVPPPQRGPLIRRIIGQASSRILSATRASLRRHARGALALLGPSPRALRVQHDDGAASCTAVHSTLRSIVSPLIGGALVAILLAVAAIDWPASAAMGNAMADATRHGLDLAAGLTPSSFGFDAASWDAASNETAAGGRHML